MKFQQGRNFRAHNPIPSKFTVPPSACENRWNLHVRLKQAEHPGKEPRPRVASRGFLFISYTASPLHPSTRGPTPGAFSLCRRDTVGTHITLYIPKTARRRRWLHATHRRRRSLSNVDKWSARIGVQHETHAVGVSRRRGGSGTGGE